WQSFTLDQSRARTTREDSRAKPSRTTGMLPRGRVSTFAHGGVQVNHRKIMTLVVCLGALITSTTGRLDAQQDPGPRGGEASAGRFFSTLGPNEQTNFADALEAFMEVDSVSGTIEGEGDGGLGPTFNGNSCAQCH